MSYSELQIEKLRLELLYDDATILIRDVKNLKIILEDNNATLCQIKDAQKKINDMMIRKDCLVAKLNAQKQVIIAAEKNEELLKAQVKKSNKASKK